MLPQQESTSQTLTSAQIGLIMKCYDKCPKTGLQPYPNGFTHNLSPVPKYSKWSILCLSRPGHIHLRCKGRSIAYRTFPTVAHRVRRPERVWSVGGCFVFGNSGDHQAYAALSQDFDEQLNYKHTVQDHQLQMTWKGGFLLPSGYR